jgi:hypothetical protein
VRSHSYRRGAHEQAIILLDAARLCVDRGGIRPYRYASIASEILVFEKRLSAVKLDPDASPVAFARHPSAV